MPPANSTPSAAEGGKSEYAITAAAEQFLEQHRERPFFCYVAHHNPHIRLAAKPKLIKKYAGAFHPVYGAMVETLDDVVGRLMRKVEQLRLAERTIFIFTSDNGGLHVLESPGTPATHNSPFRAGKGYLYEGGLREPLIVCWPGRVAAGSECAAPVVLTDLVPTLLDAAGVDVANTVGPLDGANIGSFLAGEPLPSRMVYWHLPNYTNQGGRPAGAVRDGEWKLIEQYEDHAIELYNLADDPGETTNLAGEQPERVKQLRDALHCWRKRVGAQMPTPNPEFEAELHRRLYVDPDPSRLAKGEKAADVERRWKAWREAMNASVRARKPRLTPAGGDIRLHARDAHVHGERLRYEPEPHKNVLGYWTNVEDWAEWRFTVPAAGDYEVEIQQGCGEGSGDAEVVVEVAGQTLPFTVQETGHFQAMIQRTIGLVKLEAGEATLALRPKTRPGVAVMDARRVVLRPVSRE